MFPFSSYLFGVELYGHGRAFFFLLGMPPFLELQDCHVDVPSTPVSEIKPPFVRPFVLTLVYPSLGSRSISCGRLFTLWLSTFPYQAEGPYFFLFFIKAAHPTGATEH